MSSIKKTIKRGNAKWGLLDNGGITMSVQDNSAEILELARIATLKGLEKVGDKAESHAKKLYVAVDTGHLRDSITHEVNEEKMDMNLSTNVEYGGYQELGTRKMKAHPYLKPALFNHTAEYKNILEDCYENA